MRACQPNIQGYVERDGVTLGYEVFGAGEPTVLLLPTWTIIHSRFWKLQVPYLSRRFRVITYDGPGNGRSDRVTDPARFAADAYAADALAVLDECDVERAVVVGMSLGAQYGVRLARHRPDRVLGLVLVASALPLTSPDRERSRSAQRFLGPYPENPTGWDKYNLAYWHDNYADFVEFFFDQVFSEPHSTKARDDAASWSRGAGPDILEVEAKRPPLPHKGDAVLAGVRCPTLVVHGTDDRVHPYQVGVEAARISGGPLVSLAGSGHAPPLRDPVRFNLLLRDFVERVAR